jgi:DNA primase
LPYNLPAIVAAGKTGRTGILVEGEGDADALTAIGFTSCTNPYGVDFQYPMNWHRYFDAVPRWIVVCDSDAPGRKAAAERALFIGPSATIVDLFPDDTSEKHGRDVSDWRDMHHGTPEQQRESLLAIFRAALARATR